MILFVYLPLLPLPWTLYAPHAVWAVPRLIWC